jgi:hypothetical protein
VERLEERLVPYALSGNVWPHPNLITLSFVPDGTIISGTTPSNLFATLNARWSTATWENIILKAAQTWAAQTNINFAVVSDNGTAIGGGNYQQGDPGMGDIRIGGYNFGNSALAATFMPPPINNQSTAGDVEFNTGAAFNIGSTYDLFTVAVHEIGHSLGLYHSGQNTAVMYGSYNGIKNSLTSDDTTAIRQAYSSGTPRTPDSYNVNGNNGSFGMATNLNSVFTINALTGVMSGLDITTAGQKEYFTVTAPTGTTGTFKLNVQSAGLSLLAPKVTVYAADQTTVLGSASGLGQYGTTLSVTVNGVVANQQLYVVVSGADNTAFGTGSYALTLNFGSGTSPTVPLPNTQTLNGNPISGGGGQAIKIAYETQVNTYTAGTEQTTFQTPQAVAIDSNGNYVVTWSSYGQDGSGWGVYAQRYDSTGTAQGGEFQVNTTTYGDQLFSSVAMDSAGDFVITWSDHNGADYGVRARRYNALGVAQGGEIHVNTYTPGDQAYSSVAMDAVGDFVITWSSNGQDGSGWGVYAQRYNALGVAQGGEFQVNTTEVGDQIYSRVDTDAAGDFVITWSSNGQDGSGWGVYAQRYDATGVAQGGEFQVNTTTAGDQEYSNVAMDPTGGFVITWSSNGQDGSGWGVYAQRYNSLGVAQGGEFQVNTTTAGDQKFSSVSTDGNGNILFVWQSNGQDGSGWGIFGQQYSYGGVRLGTEFQVNTTSTGDQQFASITMNSRGNAEAVWSGNGTAGSGVYSQQYIVNGTNGMSNLGAWDGFSPEGQPDLHGGDGSDSLSIVTRKLREDQAKSSVDLHDPASSFASDLRQNGQSPTNFRRVEADPLLGTGISYRFLTKLLSELHGFTFPLEDARKAAPGWSAPSGYTASKLDSLLTGNDSGTVPAGMLSDDVGDSEAQTRDAFFADANAFAGLSVDFQVYDQPAEINE